MSNQIIGNTEYKSIKDKAYINGTQENIMRLAAELDKAGINYSGRIGYKSAVTVEAADRAKALELMNGIISAAKGKPLEENSERNIIGNAEYRFIANKRYVKGETEAMLRTADRLTAENISFSGRINGDTVTLTVSGDEMKERVKKYFAEEKNISENIRSAYLLAPSSDAFEDGYYISEVNIQTGAEIAPYRSSMGDIPMFLSVDEAVKSAANEGITLSNSEAQLDNWRSEEAEKEKQSILAKSREMIGKLPKTDGEIDEYFVLREQAVDWIYFNPDGADGEGQFVVTSLYENDIRDAFEARINTENYEKFGQSAFIEAIENGRQVTVNADTPEFERYALSCINSRDKDNVIVCSPVIPGSGYNENFESVIERIENHFENVREHKEAAFKQQYVDLTNKIIDKQKDITDFTENGDLVSAAAEIEKLSAIVEKAAFAKTKLLEMDITADDVKALRSIQPARKSVQNMLENEVAQTPKFEKLLGEEMGEKSAYEMRNSGNEWRNDESKTVTVVDIQKRNIPDKVNKMKKAEGIPKGEFTNLDTGISIQFSRRSLGEIIAKAIPDEKRNIPVEARMASLYQIDDIIENAICFDSQISEANSASKSPHTLFIHRLYGVYKYDNELYLANLAIEEFYNRGLETEVDKTASRVYSFKDIKITPVRLSELNLGAIPQKASMDTSTDVTKISISQLYDIVKTYDEYFFENPKAAGRPDREAEIEAQNKFKAAMEIIAEKENTIENALNINGNPTLFSDVVFDGGNDVIVGGYIDDDSVRYMDEYMEAVYASNSDTVDVQVNYYVIGGSDNEAIEADEKQAKYIYEHLNEVLDKADLLESNRYSVEITDDEIANSDRNTPEKNLEFTVITFEDGSVYVEGGQIDDSNVKDTAAYAEMFKNNFDVNNIEDLDESIKVEYAVYRTGDGEAVMPTDEELAEIRNDIDDFIDGRDPVSEENSYLHPWQNDDDILYGMTEMWKKRHNDDPQKSDKMDSDFDLLPKNLKPTIRSGSVGYYDTLSSVRQVKLSGKEWLDPFAAAVEMNRRGVDYNDIELVNAAVINSFGYYTEKDMTPEQFAVFNMRIDNDPSRYDELISSNRRRITEKEKGLAEAKNALENNLPEAVKHTIASDELEEISEKIFTDDTHKKIEIAKQYLDGGAFSFDGIYVNVKKTDDNVLFSLDNGFEITYPWTDIAAAFEKAAVNEMEWYYTSGHVLSLYNDYLKKDTAAGGGFGVQLDRAVFTKWVSDIIARQNNVKAAYGSSDKALLEGTVRREVDDYFYMLCDKDKGIDGYDLNDISDFVNSFCNDENLRKEIYAAVTGNITVSLDALPKNEVGSEINLNNEAEKLPENVQNKVKPIYRKTKEEAIEARETDLYFADRQENRNCALAIDRSISDNNVGGSFNGGKAISDLLTEYSIDRIAMVIAARVSDAGKWDERFSRKNVEWANDILNSFNSEQVNAVSRLGLKSHSVHLNNVADELRINYEMFRSIQLGKIKEEKPEQISSDVWGSTVNSQEDSFKIYQVKNGEEYHSKRFAGLSELEGAPDIADYELVYSGQLSGLDITGESTNAILENIYTRFNIDRPQDFTGRSLSVSDVVVLHKNDSETAHYVDTAGFKDVPEFLKDRTVPAVTNGTIEKYGLDIDFKDINSIVLRTSAEEYIGGIDSDGHERRDNYTLSETDVEFYYSEHNGAVIRFDNNYPIGDMPVTIDEALEEIQNFLDEALNDSDKNIIINYNDGRGEYVYPEKLIEEKEKNKFNALLDKAKDYISSFCESEYGSTPDFDNLKNVNIAYTTLTDEELPVQVTADLADFKIVYEFDGEIFKEEQYSSLNEMVENALSALDFDELVSVPEDILEKHSSLDTMLNNSHLQENIEDSSEQLSMFESTPKRKSSDEIVSYYSSAKDAPQMEKSSSADTSANGKLKASELAVGDRFIFQGEEVTVASFKGIYPDDIGVRKIKRSGGTDLEVTSNVNKYDLVNYGKYIGNDEEKNVSGRSAAPADNIPQQEKPERKNDISADMIPCPPGTPKYSYVVVNDMLYYHKSDDHMERVNAPEKNITRIKAMTELRDSLHHLLDLQLENTDGRYENEITSAQEKLGKQYDEFSEKYGLISSAENKKLFRDDNGYYLIKSLERLDKDGNFEGKADIFYKKTVSPRVIADHCNNANDALILSLSEKCCVDLGYMSILTGKNEEELIAELGNKIFQNPQREMRWESADEYLTGNVRQKLATAEALGLERNAEALRAVIPEKINAADISARLGSAWIDPDYIRQFIIETIRPDYITSKKIEVKYSEAADKWKVEGWRTAYANTLATETYGTQDMSAYEIIEAALNMKKAEVRERVRDEYGNFVRDRKDRYIYVVNQEKTMVVQAKQDELKRKFSEWVFADPDRREKLETIYNEKFNSVRLREYDGSHLNFVGMNAAIELKPHQKNAVARDLYSEGNTLLAHEVGSGKTYEMIAIAMEGKRLGLHSKSLIAVPNALTEQWGDSFRTLYPNANVLVATEKDFKKENRRDLFAKIAAGDWDAVIIGHSQLDMIHLSKERELDILYTELDKLQKALEDMTNESGGSFSVKQIEKSIKAYESKVEKLLSKTSGDDMLCFEQLGIDKLFIDESQNYKNLDTPTKMQNVSGIGSGGSGKSMQLLMKCKYLDEITGGKGTVFASGTPIITGYPRSEMPILRCLCNQHRSCCGADLLYFSQKQKISLRA